MGDARMNDLIKIQKKLQTIIDNQEGPGLAKDYLKALDLALDQIPINLNTLTKTRIGFTVNNLRKAVRDLDEETSTMAKDLIKKWKKLLDTSKDGKGDSKGGLSPNGMIPSPATPGGSQKSNGASKDSKESSSKVDKSWSSSNGRSNSSVNNKSSSSKPSTTFTKSVSVPLSDSSASEIRQKCREMIANALRIPLPDDMNINDDIEVGEFGDPDKLAEEIESHIFREVKNTEDKYKNRVRSRTLNLRDQRNPDLRLNVLRGIISTERIAKMESTEMASVEMKALREKITKEAIQEHQMSLTGGTSTDLIKCPKCKKSNTTYSQMQTRSADEPMTTFCLCNECGKRWKFC